MLIVAVLWLGFMTPSGKRGLSDRKVKTKKQRKIRTVSYSAAQRNPVVATREANSYLASRPAQVEIATPVAQESQKVVVNRLPDPLSARLGKIESVQWAQVHELEDARVEKEQLSSENLDEILRRRRSNGSKT